MSPAADANIALQPVAWVRGARARVEDDHWGGSQATVELDPAFDAEALEGLDAFSHVELLFWFHAVDPAKVVSGARHPRNNPDWPCVGIFAQRGKNRPNRLGSTICRLIAVEGRRLRVAELDAIDGTPVLDIKPVMAEFLPREPVRQPAWSRELMARYWDFPPADVPPGEVAAGDGAAGDVAAGDVAAADGAPDA